MVSCSSDSPVITCNRNSSSPFYRYLRNTERQQELLPFKHDTHLHAYRDHRHTRQASEPTTTELPDMITTDL